VPWARILGRRLFSAVGQIQGYIFLDIIDSAMGLDALVYRSKVNLPFDPDAVSAVFDESTGECYVSDLDRESAFEQKFPRETRISADKRIGNIDLAEIGYPSNKPLRFEMNSFSSGVMPKNLIAII